MPDFVTLEGYSVVFAGPRAVGVRKMSAAHASDDLAWLPRSLCQDGDDLAKGDTDIVVQQWKAEQEGLDF